MKKQFYYGALLGTVLLASCSLDDALDTNSVASNANPNSPVFSVSFEADEETRAVFEATKGGLTFNQEDFMSLFHTVAKSNNAESDGTYNAEKFQNAIYSGAEGADGNSLEFTTQAYVNEGLAIMKYPGEKTPEINVFDGTATQLFLKVEDTQGEDYKATTPYISEFLTIGAYDATTGNKSGYGEPYEIKLKRAAGTLAVKVNFIGGGSANTSSIKPENVQVRSIKFSNENEVFATKARVAISDEPSLAAEKEENGKKPYADWKNQSKVVSLNDGAVSTITTSDILKAERTAYFTLLPMLGKVKNATMEVITDYGTVIVRADDAEAVTSKKLGMNISITEVINGCDNGKSDAEKEELDSYWDNVLKGATAGVFYDETTKNGEEVGRLYTINLNVKLSDLDMDGMHIANSATDEDLILKAEIVEQFGIKLNEDGSKNTFYLDGDENGEFHIRTQKGLEAYQKLISYVDKTAQEEAVQLAKCDGSMNHTACTKVVFDDNGGKALNDGTNNLKLAFAENEDVPVVLAGTAAWTIGKVVAENVKSITIAKDATANFSAEVSAENVADGIINNGTINITEETTVKAKVTNNGIVNVNGAMTLDTNAELENNGTINVEAKMDLQADVTNNGTINLNNVITVKGSAKLLNKATKVKDLPTPYTIEQLNSEEYIKRGIINVKSNSAQITAVGGASGYAANYGKIIIAKAATNAALLLKENATKNTTFDASYSDEKIMGIIDLGSNDLGSRVNIKDGKGIIKTTKATATKANYLVYTVAENETVNVEKGENFEVVELVKPTPQDGQSNTTLYADIEGKVKNLIVNTGMSLNLRQSGKLSVDNLYLKSELIQAGTLNNYTETETETESGTVSYQSYFGGSEADKTAYLREWGAN